MKNLLILFALILPTILNGQRDFDYTIFTTNVDLSELVTEDSTALTSYRIITKKANVLTISNPINTADTETYLLEFVGYQTNTQLFIYKATHWHGNGDLTIYVQPITPYITIRDYNSYTTRY